MSIHTYIFYTNIYKRRILTRPFINHILKNKKSINNSIFFFYYLISITFFIIFIIYNIL